jgi:transmembrane sensor
LSEQDPQQTPCEPAAAPARKTRLWIPALFAALIVLGLWGPNLLRPPPPAWTIYTATKGQIRRVALSDKSVLRLNGASSVRMVFEDGDRRAALGEAEAAFLISSDPRRPFLISAGDREVQMDGGELNILRQTALGGGGVTVLTVRQGRARIYPLGQPQATGVTVGAGQQAAWADGQAQPSVRAVNAANAFAWETHQLAYDRAPLGEVISDLNRYVARPIRLADPALAALPFTGMLTLEGEDGMLRKLEKVLPLQHDARAAEIILRRLPPCGFKNCDKPVRRRKPNAIVQSILKLNQPAPPARLPTAAPPPTARPGTPP